MRNALQKYVLPDGREIFVIEDPDEALALKEMLENRVWWKETTKRVKRVSWIAGAMVGAVGIVAAQWPLITQIFQLIIHRSPSP